MYISLPGIIFVAVISYFFSRGKKKDTEAMQNRILDLEEEKQGPRYDLEEGFKTH